MQTNNDLIFTPGQILNATVGSVPQWAWAMVRASFMAVVSAGTAAGSLQLQWSDDKAVGLPANQFVPTNWVNLGSSVAVTGAGIYAIPLQEICYEYLRVLYTDTSSGTGTSTIICRMKNQSL